MKVAVFGLGFVGLTTAVGLAKKCVDNSIKIIGYEIESSKCQMLQNNQIPFFEEGLNQALKEVQGKNLTLTHDIKLALKDTKVIFYCIGTPMDQDGSADLSHILSALKTFAQNITLCEKKPILVVKSTIPPSSSSEVFIPFLESLGLQKEKDFVLANNPEFLREGFAYDDFMNPDRILIGSQDSQTINELENLYKPFKAPIVFTNLNTAEFIKYLSNTTLSMMISYANEMSMIAQTIGDIDIPKAFKTLHTDKRFYGNPAIIVSYLYPGMGFGGYCLPKDTLALNKKAQDKGYKADILQNIIRVNEKILDFYLAKIKQETNESDRIAVLGLSFKPLSDDVRDSKSFSLIQKLISSGFKHIAAYDPIAIESFKETYALEIDYFYDLDNILKDSDVFIIATAWDEFKNIPIKGKKVYNLRYISLDNP